MKETPMEQSHHQSDKSKCPHGIRHIAFIMDGNGRWAKARNLPRTMGHKEGFKRVREIASACRKLQIECMSLFAFSTENWKRPQDEIDFLFDYLDRFIKRELPTLIKEDCRLRVSGDIARLPLHSQTAITEALNKTAHCQSYVLNICLNYGGQQDVLRATKSLAAQVKDGTLALEDINHETFSNALYTAGLPPIDLMIRTSGELRISNFMMYQLAYSELIFPPTAWPDFTKNELLKCLDEFGHRQRRYAGL
jgi:undecaprenyl diphosphate synthase